MNVLEALAYFSQVGGLLRQNHEVQLAKEWDALVQIGRAAASQHEQCFDGLCAVCDALDQLAALGP